MTRERKRGTIAERIEKLKAAQERAVKSAARADARAERLAEQIERLTREAREAAGV